MIIYDCKQIKEEIRGSRYRLMNKKEQLEFAIKLASKYHEGQVDKSGQPYILHPLAVMTSVKTLDEKIVATLHDIVEDTPMTITKLRCLGFDEDIIYAINKLTRDKSVDYFDYVNGLAECELAKTVKIADLTHNLRPGCPDTLRKRYLKALDILQNN